MLERAATLEVIGLIMFAPLLYSMFFCGYSFDYGSAAPEHPCSFILPGRSPFIFPLVVAVPRWVTRGLSGLFDVFEVGGP
jgi:hypothetical protein